MIQWIGSPHNWDDGGRGYRRVAATDRSTAGVTDGNWQNRQSSRRPRDIQAPDAYAEYKKEGKEAPSRRGKNDSRGQQCCTANGDGRFEQDRDGEECVWCCLSDHTDFVLRRSGRATELQRLSNLVWVPFFTLPPADYVTPYGTRPPSTNAQAKKAGVTIGRIGSVDCDQVLVSYRSV